HAGLELEFLWGAGGRMPVARGLRMGGQDDLTWPVLSTTPYHTFNHFCLLPNESLELISRGSPVRSGSPPPIKPATSILARTNIGLVWHRVKMRIDVQPESI